MTFGQKCTVFRLLSLLSSSVCEMSLLSKLEDNVGRGLGNLGLPVGRDRIRFVSASICHHAGYERGIQRRIQRRQEPRGDQVVYAAILAERSQLKSRTAQPQPRRRQQLVLHKRITLRCKISQQGMVAPAVLRQT